jgi:hypothetical protein
MLGSQSRVAVMVNRVGTGGVGRRVGQLTAAPLLMNS